MSRLVILFGPQAVGKMTVGKILALRTGFNFMMNHTTIDMLLPFFEWSDDSFQRLNSLFRAELVKEHALSKKSLIFTYVWDLNCSWDKKEVDRYRAEFEESGGTVYFVELQADFDTRLVRNVSSERLEAKPPKRDIEQSTKFLHDGENHKCNSSDDFYYKDENYVKIENDSLTPEEVSNRICEEFGW